MTEIDSSVIVIINQASFSMSKNDKGISSVPKHTSVPASLLKDRDIRVDSAPGQGLQI